MAYTSTITDCDTYFLPDNHIKSYGWRKYKKDERNAAFAHAKRILETALGRVLKDPTSDDDLYRDDYAHFEQALWILESVPRQKSDGIDGVIDFSKNDAEDDIDQRKPILLAPEAKQYLAKNMIKIVRG